MSWYRVTLNEDPEQVLEEGEFEVDVDPGGTIFALAPLDGSTIGDKLPYDTEDVTLSRREASGAWTVVDPASLLA